MSSFKMNAPHLKLLALTILIGLTLHPSFVYPQAGTIPEVGIWGFDLGGRNLQAKAGDDFYEYAVGQWIDRATIPSDEVSWDTLTILQNEALQDLRRILTELKSKKHPQGSAKQQVTDWYQAYMDTPKIQARGLKPLMPELAEIRAADSHEKILAIVGRPDFQGGFPLSLYIGIDEKNPDRYVPKLSQSGLSLPNRDYYLKSEAKFKEIRKQFVAYIAKLLGMAGYPNTQTMAQGILELETQIAQLHWPIAKKRNRDLTYNPKTLAQLQAVAPQFPWDLYLKAKGLEGRNFFVVRELGAVSELAQFFKTIPVSAWQDYLIFQLLNRNASVLPRKFDRASFEFNQGVLAGQKVQAPRWKRAVITFSLGSAGLSLSEALGRFYVAKHFLPETQAAIKQLVTNLRQAYEDRISKLDWMGPETRKQALKKLKAFQVKVGYPDRWKDLSALTIRAGEAYENKKRVDAFEWERELNRIDQKTERGEWGIPPHVVNAYYNATFNEIVFPAAILQAPYFDPQADLAVNYGGIGGIIGHEMAHAFDDQGAKSDGQGRLRNWWTDEDKRRFEAKSKALATQYDQYQPLPGLQVSGANTSGENMGDLGGLSVALEAYYLALKGNKPPVLDGFSGEQRFFLAWAQAWRAKIREPYLRFMVTSDVHPPPKFRVNGVVRNMDAWYEAFDIKPGNGLYLAPDQRVQIW